MKKKVLFLAVVLVGGMAAYAQNKVNGTVIDRTDNSKLIGVNVTLSNDSGQVAGTTTDNSGKFSLDADTGNYILELSYIGYETIRMALTVNGDTHIGDILMQEGAMELGEVVVESQAIIQKVDRQILLPSKEQMQASSDGVSLLQNLQIPRIVISPIDNSVKTLSDESVRGKHIGCESHQPERYYPRGVSRPTWRAIQRCGGCGGLYCQAPRHRRQSYACRYKRPDPARNR